MCSTNRLPTAITYLIILSPDETDIGDNRDPEECLALEELRGPFVLSYMIKFVLLPDIDCVAFL